MPSSSSPSSGGAGGVTSPAPPQFDVPGDVLRASLVNAGAVVEVVDVVVVVEVVDVVDVVAVVDVLDVVEVVEVVDVVDVVEVVVVVELVEVVVVDVVDVLVVTGTPCTVARSVLITRAAKPPVDIDSAPSPRIAPGAQRWPVNRARREMWTVSPPTRK